MMYPRTLSLALVCCFLAGHRPACAAEDWRPLLDASLTQWESWIGVPHTSVPIAWDGKAEDGKSGRPLGLGRDERGIYTVSLESGEPVLRVSGEIYAGLTTREEFGDYHLRLEFRWGDRKWPPRLERLRDSGVLYHGTGEHGAFWNVWMRSLECQIQEGDCGDLYLLGGPAAQVRAVLPAPTERLVYDPGAEPVAVGNRNPAVVRHGPSVENAHGDWNVIEIMAVGDRAVHLVNGRVVMVLENATIESAGRSVPLTQGRLQLQSEASEVYYRRVAIRPLREFPSEIATSAGWPSGQQ